MHKSLYPWQQADWQQLIAYVNAARVPQALLIQGKKGLGKSLLAQQFAQYLMCSHRQAAAACGQCETCQLFQADTHPDFIRLKPEAEGKAITIDTVRKMMAKLVLKPQYSGYRVVFINPADKLNINSANAVLKCLEEPPERTIFLLIAEQFTQLPATILSRCQRLLIPKPANELANKWLLSQGVAPATSLKLLALAQGSPLLALTYLEQDRLAQYTQCLEQWLAVLLKQSCPVELAAQWQNKVSLDCLLVWLMNWTGDIIKYYLQVKKPELFKHQDLQGDLQPIAKLINLERLFKFYHLLIAQRAMQTSSLNQQLILEEILINSLKLRQK